MYSKILTCHLLKSNSMLFISLFDAGCVVVMIGKINVLPTCSLWYISFSIEVSSMSKSSLNEKSGVDLSPRYSSPLGIQQRYSISVHKLAQLRFRRIGPTFRRIGYRSIVYPITEFERWLESQPRGGKGSRVPPAPSRRVKLAKASSAIAKSAGRTASHLAR